ncbi:MAG: hypothetical protein AAGI23_09365 [Bacteroidota bacterium]
MKFRTKNIVPTATKVGAMAGGVVVSRMMNSMSFMTDNPAMGGGVKLAAGVVLMGQKGIIADVAAGVAIDGALTLLGHFTTKEGEARSAIIPAGIYGPQYLTGGMAGGSTRVHAVAGSGYQHIMVD